MELNNFNIESTVLTNEIRVSTAGVWLSFEHGSYLQYETWVFSKDPNQRSIQVIHGTHYAESEVLDRISRKVHNYMVNNLKKKLSIS